METEKNEKVLAMYHAVWHLIEEGKDIHKIKVSDITERAGIGKGTAYEYFRSKEEIVGKAMQYHASMQFRMLQKRIEEQDSYRKGLEACFDWISETRDRSHFMIEFFGDSNGIKPEACFCLKEEKKSPVLMIVEQTLARVAALGRKEGRIREEIPDQLVSLQIFSQLLGFLIYQESGDFADEADIIKTKAFLCDNIIKSLS